MPYLLKMNDQLSLSPPYDESPLPAEQMSRNLSAASRSLSAATALQNDTSGKKSRASHDPAAFADAGIYRPIERVGYVDPSTEYPARVERFLRDYFTELDVSLFQAGGTRILQTLLRDLIS